MSKWSTFLLGFWSKGRSLLRAGSPREPNGHCYSPLVEQIRGREADFLSEGEASIEQRARELRKRDYFDMQIFTKQMPQASRR